jgi:DNA-directed RNA polymerase subunit N (RpoN/RPB10)
MAQSLRCYVCGKPTGDQFAVVAMSKDSDRAFVVHTGSCLDRVDEDVEVRIIVERKT